MNKKYDLVVIGAGLSSLMFLNRYLKKFKKHSVLSLEYKPFSRFSLAKSLDEVFENKLSKTLNEIINDAKKYYPDHLVIGNAPQGGIVSKLMYLEIEEAIKNGKI